MSIWTAHTWIGLSTKKIFIILFSLQLPALCEILNNRTTSLVVFSLLGIHTPDPKAKPSYHQRRQSKDDETASSSPYGRETGRYTHLNSPEPRRSAYVVYRTVTQKPKFNGSTGEFLCTQIS